MSLLIGLNKRLLGFGVLLAIMQNHAVWSATPAKPVFAAEVKKTFFTDRIEALGTLRANESVELTASVTEKVNALYFDDGSRVTAGDLLVEMTSAEEHAQLEEARALTDEADSQYRRVKSLAAQGTAARSLLDERRRQQETARARLAAIESRLSDRLIKAPFSGVVGLRNISVGALVEPGDIITTLDDDTVMKLDLSVPDVYLARLKLGLTVLARTRTHKDREFKGEVHSIDSRIDEESRSVVVRVLLDNHESLLKHGMLMEVTLLKNPRETLVIPEAALMPVGREQFVLVAEPNEEGHLAVRRSVEIGARRPGEVEISSGLEAGELVITEGGIGLKTGQAIAVRAIDDGTRNLTDLLSDKDEAIQGGQR